MKKVTLAAAFIAVPMILSATTAESFTVPGSVMKTRLNCQPIDLPLGTGYGVLLKTQAVHPQHNVRGISLLSWVVYPNAPTTEKDLEQLHQDKTSATFVSADGHVKVELNKKRLRAEVFFDGKLALNCQK
jgi:hypothetical protein